MSLQELKEQAAIRFQELGFAPSDIVRNRMMPEGIVSECIDDRTKVLLGKRYVRTPGTGLALAADAFSAITEIWGEGVAVEHEDSLISELVQFYRGKIPGHTDDGKCETGFCGCGHVKETIFEQASPALRSFLLKISSNPEIYNQSKVEGEHDAFAVVHAGKYNVPSEIEGKQAYVYHGDYHQAKIEAVSGRVAAMMIRLGVSEGLGEQDVQMEIFKPMSRISGDRTKETVARLAGHLEHVSFESSGEN